MTDKFEDIRTFIAVVQAKGFAGAAARMGLAKSAISRRVSDLEDRLGTRLLHRTTREVRLTEPGAGFYDRSIKLLADLEEAEDSASKGGSEPIGKLRVTAPVSFGLHCMAPILDALGLQLQQRGCAEGDGRFRLRPRVSSTFIIYRAVEEGRLETCLTDYSREEIGLHALYPSTRNLSARVRVFIDFLIERFGDKPFWDRAIFRGRSQTRSDQA